MTPAQIAETYDLTVDQVREAQAFYAAHLAEIDEALAAEAALDAASSGSATGCGLEARDPKPLRNL